MLSLELLQLCEQIKKYSGFYTESNSINLLSGLEDEIGELKDAINGEGNIIDEIGDVVVQSIILYSKVLEENNLTNNNICYNQIIKYSIRAPHILKGVHMDKEQEVRYWDDVKANV